MGTGGASFYDVFASHEIGHRKPQPGMLRTAARELGLSLADCWMVGDKESDVEAGRAAGCRTVLLAPDSPVPDLLTAAYTIRGA